MPGKVHIGAQLSLLVGDVSLGLRDRGHIHAARIPVKVHGEECIPRADGPTAG